MYAIVEINGHQFKVEAGKKLFVDHLAGVEAGKTVEFDKVLLLDKDGQVTVGAPTVKGDKVLIFHKKRRKGYRKLNGFRHQFTELSIKEVKA